jgi:hypothetical protein
MTRTNAENHFATHPSGSVSKWYAASRQTPRRLTSYRGAPASASLPACRPLLPNLRLSQLFFLPSASLGIGRQIRDLTSCFSPFAIQKDATSLPCLINDEICDRTQIVTSDVLSIVQNHPNIRQNSPRQT